MDQAAYYRSHPPRCIAGFVARPTELPGTEFDGHVTMSQLDLDVPSGVRIEAPEHINPVFALSCRCGGTRHYVHAYRWVNPDFNNATVYLSPLVLECAACGKLTDLRNAPASLAALDGRPKTCRLRLPAVSITAQSSWSSSFFGPTSAVDAVAPVTLPPGRLRLATSPIAIGSFAVKKTIGIVLVAALAALTPKVLFVVRTVTLRLTRSAASCGNCSI